MRAVAFGLVVIGGALVWWAVTGYHSSLTQVPTGSANPGATGPGTQSPGQGWHNVGPGMWLQRGAQ